MRDFDNFYYNKSKRLFNELRNHGILPSSVETDANNPSLFVQVYERTPEFMAIYLEYQNKKFEYYRSIGQEIKPASNKK